MTTGILEFLTIFVLAAFVGNEVIGRVPSILHTPLMSGSNAIHGIVLVGTILIMGGATAARSPPTECWRCSPPRRPSAPRRRPTAPEMTPPVMPGDPQHVDRSGPPARR